MRSVQGVAAFSFPICIHLASIPFRRTGIDWMGPLIQPTPPCAEPSRPAEPGGGPEGGVRRESRAGRGPGSLPFPSGLPSLSSLWPLWLAGRGRTQQKTDRVPDRGSRPAQTSRVG